MKDSLGDRMKGYEGVTRGRVLPRTPVIIRLDGKAFHTFTKGMDRPFDSHLMECMRLATYELVDNIQNAVFGYTQSDEISILLMDWKKFNTSQWFDGGIQKIASVSASMCTAYFNDAFDGDVSAFFDARVFNVPREEVANYFLWRQQDAERNSIQMLGQYHFSHKELQGKSNNEVMDMLVNEKGVHWNHLTTWKKRGTSVLRYPDVGLVARGAEQFKYERNMFNTLMVPEEE